MKVWRPVLGWTSALAIGGGGAFALQEIPPPPISARSVAAPPEVSGWIEASGSGVESYGPEGWSALEARVFGSLRARTVGREAKLTVKAGDLSAVAGLDAELVVSALGAPSLSLDAGQVTVTSESAAVVFVPGLGVRLRGAHFGVLLEQKRLSIATLAPLEVTKPGHRAELFPAGQEILIEGDALQPFVLGRELRLILKKKRSVLTSPAALLMVETEDGIERISPDENGRALVPRRRRSLIAVDALGRIAALTSERPRRGKRAVLKDDDSIPLSIPMGGSLGHAEIAKPEASLPQLLEEKQSSLEKEMGDLDEETKEAIRDF